MHGDAAIALTCGVRWLSARGILLAMSTDLAPQFTPKPLKDGSGWYVLASWPNGREEQIDGFVTEAEAQTWIRDESAAWLAAPEHPDPNQLVKAILDKATGDDD